jgi:hypothetical protein
VPPFFVGKATTSPQLGWEPLTRPEISNGQEMSGLGGMKPLESSMRTLFQSKIPLAIFGAAILFAASEQAAKADVHQIGSVNVSADHYTNISWEHFEGAVEKLQFVAEGDTLDCAHISVTYRDGTTHTVFRGVLPMGAIETVTFPEGDSRMRHVDFACKAHSIDGARVALSAVSEGIGEDRWAREPHVTIYEDSTVVSPRGTVITR